MKKVTRNTPYLSRFLRSATTILVLLTATFTARAQTAVPCPQNIDFSFGNFNNWLCYTAGCIGAYYPGYTPASSVVPFALTGVTLSGPVGGTAPYLGTSRHALTTGTGTDYYGGFPEVAPGGGLFSLRIGNDLTGAQAELVRYMIHVPVGFNNYSFNFRYAVVFEDPGHNFYEQPRFTVTGYDSATGSAIPCATQTYVSGAGLPGFQTSTKLSAENLYPLYLPWTLGNLNLSGQGGKTIIVEVMSSDCTLGGHFGYGYFDVVSCGQFNATITYCDPKSGIITASGPPGYKYYEWWDQNFTTRINGAPYNQQTLNLPLTNNCQYYNLVLTPYNSNGCPDTIHTRRMCDFHVDAKPDSLCNTLGKQIPLTATVTGGLGGFNYSWTATNANVVNAPTNAAVTSGIVNSTGYFVITVKDSNQCVRQDTVKIDNPDFHVNLGPDVTTCLGTAVRLAPSITPANAPGYVYSWIPGAGISDPTASTPVYTPSVVGTQQLILKIDSGICATSDTFNIITLPNDFKIHDTAVCQKDSVIPFISGDQRFSYRWTWTGPAANFGKQILYFEMPATATSPQTPGFNADTTRTFTITASYPTCPDIVKQLTVRVEPRPIVSLVADSVFKCQYAPVYVTAHVGPSWFSNYTYQWRSNSFIDHPQSPIVQYSGDVDTNLLVTVRTPLGCAGRDSVHVHVYPGGFGKLSPLEPQVCPLGNVVLTASGGSSYRWEPALYLSNANSAAVTAQPVSTTDYNVYVTDAHGCIDTLHTTVTVNPEGTVSLPDTVVLYPGQSYQMSPQGNLLYYSWFPTVGLLPNASVANPTAAPLVNTLYHVNGMTEAGCPASDSVYVLVRDESAIEMPNAFSPGSAPNEILKVLHLGTATLKSFRIYNRWGSKLFETTNINQGWDGTFNGTAQPLGVYVYVVEARTNSGKVISKQGNVTLLR